MALAIDQEGRPAGAPELAEALQDGARGVSPVGADRPNFATSASTGLLADQGPETAATRLSPRQAPPQTTRAAPRRAEPRRAEPRQAPRRVAPNDNRRPAPPRRAPERETRRGFSFMALLALLAVFAVVVIAAVVISDSTTSTAVHYQKIIARDAQSAISQIQSLVKQYTK